MMALKLDVLLMTMEEKEKRRRVDETSRLPYLLTRPNPVPTQTTAHFRMNPLRRGRVVNWVCACDLAA